MQLLQTRHGLNSGFFSNCSVRLHQIVRYLNKQKRLPDVVCSKNQFDLFQQDRETDVIPFFFQEDRETQISFRHRVDFIHSKQFSNYKLLNFQDLIPLVKKYFTPSAGVLEKKQEFTREYGIDFRVTVGVIYRGNDKATETALPSYRLFLEQARRLLKQEPELRFLVQTDEKEFLQEFSREFPSSFFFKTLPPHPPGPPESDFTSI